MKTNFKREIHSKYVQSLKKKIMYEKMIYKKIK